MLEVGAQGPVQRSEGEESVGLPPERVMRWIDLEAQNEAQLAVLAERFPAYEPRKGCSIGNWQATTSGAADWSTANGKGSRCRSLRLAPMLRRSRCGGEFRRRTAGLLCRSPLP